MPRGQYKRTDEIRNKQSDSAKRNYQEGVVDQDQRNAAHRATIEQKRVAGERLGRKPASEGGKYKRLGTTKPCPVCSTDVYHTQGDVAKGKRKCCSKDCLRKDPEFISKMKSVDKSYMQTEAYKATKRCDDTPEYTRYKNAVHRKSHQTYENNVDSINPNGYPRTLCGVDGGWQLDHIKPIKECFLNGVTVEEASDVSNLRMLPWKDNLMRNFNSVGV